MIAQVKICEACGSDNDSFAVMCFCGQPISHILPIAKFTAQEPKEATVLNLTGGEKTCAKCGGSHPSHRLSCDCGARLPSAASAQAETLPIVVASPAESWSSEVVKGQSNGELFLRFASKRVSLQNGDILGRQGTVEASSFAVVKEVSREHARILLLDDGWFIVGLSANMTEVDGQLLDRGKPYPLTGIHRVRLSSKCEINLEVE